MLLDLFSFFLHFMNNQHIGKPLFFKKRKKVTYWRIPVYAKLPSIKKKHEIVQIVSLVAANYPRT